MADPNLAQLAEEQAQRLEEAEANFTAAQAKQKAAFDKMYARSDCFKKGQLVVKKDFTHKKWKGGKLNARFQGPYIIH